MSKALCLYAFDTLVSDLQGSSSKSLSKFLSANSESFDQFPDSAPLFVTWDESDQLRGCIGTFYPQPIESGVKRFARSAAFNDPRFPPIARAELPRLSCSITLLDKFVAISNCLEWQVGKHGLKLSIDDEEGHFSGTFLPSVAEEQGWDHLTTLYYLLKKADYNSIGKSKVESFYGQGLKQGWLKLETYEGLKYGLDYHEYIEFIKAMD